MNIIIIHEMIAYALMQSGQLEYASSDLAFPELIKTSLPSDLRGLVAGGLHNKIVFIGRITTVVLVILGIAR